MDIVFLGQQNWDHCWTAKQQLATRLAERGHRVLYVDPDFPPRETRADLRSASVPGVPGLRRRGPKELYTFTYLPIPALRWRLNLRRQPMVLVASLRQLGFHAPVVLCLHPKQWRNLAKVRPSALVYYAVDEYTGYERMAEAERQEVRAREDAILADCDVALAVSDRLRRRFAETAGAAYILENGSDVDHYRPERLARLETHPAIADVAGPVVGFIGQVDSRIDADLVASLAERHPDWTFAFAGRQTGSAVDALEDRPNVRFLGYTPYERLPAFARGVDVWTVPYVESSLTHACNPLKVYEYLATGRPVVSRPLDGLVICRDVVTLAGDANAFSAAVGAALADPDAGRDQRLARAEANDWHRRVDRLEEHFVEAIDRARASGRWLRAVTPLPRAARLAAPLDRSRVVDEYGDPRPDANDAMRRWRAAVFLTDAAGRVMFGGTALRRILQGRSPVKPRRILVPWFGRLGDYVAIAPMLAHLRQAFPEAVITLGVPDGSPAFALFRRSSDVDEVLAIDFARWRTTLDARARMGRFIQLFGRRYDLVISGAHWFVMSEALLSGARTRVGLYDGHPLQRLGVRGLRRDLSCHEADNDLALAEAVTRRPADRRRGPRLSVDEAAVAAAGPKVAGALGISPDAPVIVVHPGSKLPSRRWPADRYAGLLANLLEDDERLVAVLTGTAEERDAVAEVMAALPEELAFRARDATGSTDLSGLLWLLDRASVVVSNDTGVMHLARARGAPLVAVLGPENHRLWGPYPQGDAPAVAVRREVPCAPCRRHACQVHYCLESVPTDVVVRAVRDVLSRGRNGDGSLALDLDRLSWTDLSRRGMSLPLVTVVVEETDGSILPAVLPVIEAQTYPLIEIVCRWPSGAEAFVDRRDAQRQAALPLRVVPDDPVDAARGTLLVRARAGADWRSSRLALDVAAATRTEADAAFFDGERLSDQAVRPDALVRHRPSTQAQAAASGPARALAGTPACSAGDAAPARRPLAVGHTILRRGQPGMSGREAVQSD